MRDPEVIHIRAVIDHFWVARSGFRWCFMWINNNPYLAGEEDVI